MDEPASGLQKLAGESHPLALFFAGNALPAS
jgi:hypothetical protein